MTQAGIPDPAALFAGVAFAADTFSEAFAARAQPRAHWKQLLAALDALGPSALDQRQERVRRMRHEDGATYNPFDTPGGRGIPWALDTVPLPITSSEWAGLEAGLIQRARLLERILADVYGPQTLLRQGRIPQTLLFANPGFLRPCHGIQPSGGRFLPYYAADLVRQADGRFRVLRDYGANPAGLGYALENRIVVSRVFAELYHKAQILRLAPFFHAFQRTLGQRALTRGDDTGIVILSPGPECRIYFEHALLSRYLGYPLVEGQDLTVRNGEVFLKKLAGLEPVAAIFRHIEDAASDPFALRRDTAAGVAGLLQVCREGRIDLVNPIGSGFVDTPALGVFLPDLCRHLMDEDLALESLPAWWCAMEAHRDHVLAHLEHLTVAPALDRSLTVPPPPDLAAAIHERPHAYMAAEPLRPASVPAWEQGQGACSRHVMLRVFACATDRGFSVMPGGLAITAAEPEALTQDVPERLRSKDIWVLSDRPVTPFSLMESLTEVAEFKRGSDLPSRAADHLLWLGRYLERAEGRVRLLRAVFGRLSGEAPSADIPELPFLINLLRAEDAVTPAADGGDGVAPFRELTASLDEALYRPDRTESVVAILKRVLEAARNVRDRLSLDAWRVINRLQGFAETPANDPLELLDDTLFTLSAFSGLAMESMTRGLGWRFMDMGRRVERAINQSRRIRIGLERVCGESNGAMEALLEISDSIMTYRARYRTVFQLAPVLDLLLADESNPKSLAFQLSRIADHVTYLPRPDQRRFASVEERLSLEMLTGVRLLDLNGVDCGSKAADHAALVSFLTTTEASLAAFAQQVTAHYLSRVPSTPHFSADGGERKP